MKTVWNSLAGSLTFMHRVSAFVFSIPTCFGLFKSHCHVSMGVSSGYFASVDDVPGRSDSW